MINKDQKDYIIKLLQEGKELPEEFKYLLFPAKQKEYELTYAGKMRKEDILANEDGVFPVPLQTEKIFNGNKYEGFDDDWKNMIVFGDNLQFLKTIYENKDPLIKDKVKGKVKLIYIDPPFATIEDFQGNKGQKAYSDKKKGAEFIEFLRRRLIVAKEILDEQGSIYVHLDEKRSHYIKIVMDELGFKFQREIIWRIGWLSGYKTKAKNWIRNHDVILFYTKSDDFEFNKEYIPYPDDYVRRDGSEPDGRGYAIEDTWNCSELDSMNSIQIMSFSNEKTGYPTQKNENLLKRIINSATNRGDIILDFFGGSGSTIAVAEKLGRKWITCDIGKLSYFTMQKRILQIQNSKDLENPKKKYGKKAKSFITASLGSYDLEKTFELERKKYLEFVSGLFEINLKQYKISGFNFDGKKDDYPVIIYDYNKYKNLLIDENYLDNLHENIGKKLGSRVYIVAPINYVDFVDDFAEKEDTRYYFLKIPYHVINELHKKPFVKVRQPQSKSRVNDIEEAVGFHFKRAPEVQAELKKEKDVIKIIIKNFKTTELLYDKTKEERSFDNFETLSAVFVDKSYNGEFFEMDDAFFADDLLPKKPKKEDDLRKYLQELSKTGVEISFKKSKVKDQIMIVFTDIYGNDFTQTFKI